jgi:hypothetical protein
MNTPTFTTTYLPGSRDPIKKAWTYEDMKIASTSLNERNDCFVKALALLEDIPYYQAYELCKYFGRRDRKITFWKSIKNLCASLNLAVFDVRITLARVNINNAIICSRTHAFTVKDGQQFDYKKHKGNMRVYAYITREVTP